MTFTTWHLSHGIKILLLGICYLNPTIIHITFDYCYLYDIVTWMQPSFTLHLTTVICMTLLPECSHHSHYIWLLLFVWHCYLNAAIIHITFDYCYLHDIVTWMQPSFTLHLTTVICMTLLPECSHHSHYIWLLLFVWHCYLNAAIIHITFDYCYLYDIVTWMQPSFTLHLTTVICITLLPECSHHSHYIWLLLFVWHFYLNAAIIHIKFDYCY